MLELVTRPLLLTLLLPPKPALIVSGIGSWLPEKRIAFLLLLVKMVERFTTWNRELLSSASTIAVKASPAAMKPLNPVAPAASALVAVALPSRELRLRAFAPPGKP